MHPAKGYAMQYFVERKGIQSGPHTLADINARLAQGTWSSGDLAWDGSPGEWIPLREVEGAILPTGVPALESLVGAPDMSEEYMEMEGDLIERTVDHPAFKPLLGVALLIGTLIWAWSRDRMRTVQSVPVKPTITEEAATRLGKIGGIFEADANGELVTIIVANTPVSETGWKLLGQLKNVRKLILKNCSLKDDDLKNLALLPQLEILGLAENSITDHGIASIGDLSELTALDVQGTKITSTGAEWLREHTDAKVFH